MSKSVLHSILEFSRLQNKKHSLSITVFPREDRRTLQLKLLVRPRASEDPSNSRSILFLLKTLGKIIGELIGCGHSVETKMPNLCAKFFRMSMSRCFAHSHKPHCWSIQCTQCCPHTLALVI